MFDHLPTHQCERLWCLVTLHKMMTADTFVWLSNDSYLWPCTAIYRWILEHVQSRPSLREYISQHSGVDYHGTMVTPPANRKDQNADWRSTFFFLLHMQFVCLMLALCKNRRISRTLGVFLFFSLLLLLSPDYKPAPSQYTVALRSVRGELVQQGLLTGDKRLISHPSL